MYIDAKINHKNIEVCQDFKRRLTMNIKKLSKAIQEYIQDELTYIVIYKTGRSWNYEFLYETDQDNYIQDEEYIKAYKIDKKAIVINGYFDNFGNNTLQDIEYRIKYNYDNSIGNFKPIQADLQLTTYNNIISTLMSNDPNSSCDTILEEVDNNLTRAIQILKLSIERIINDEGLEGQELLFYKVQLDRLKGN
jgi:hypothetical protein